MFRVLYWSLKVGFKFVLEIQVRISSLLRSFHNLCMRFMLQRYIDLYLSIQNIDLLETLLLAILGW